ncbi:MAG: aldehyde dehydrogenase family protein, partial [Ruthenibacterium sp.]
MMDIAELVARQRAFFESGATRAISYRAAALQALEQAIRLHEKEICNALYNDLGKSSFESYMTEIGLVLDELRFQRRHLAKFAKSKRARTPLAQFKASSRILAEPYGVALVMSPWNYPFMLTLDPIIGAIAAGNCVVVKPSAYSASTSELLRQLVSGLFQEDYIAVVPGGRAENALLLEQKFDYIFFTGGVGVGRLVMEKAAQHLTPLTLELGGKSPCIVERTANVKLAAKRIVFGKYLNAGQTCVAPDYLFVQEEVRDLLVGYIKQYITEFFGAKPLENRDFGRIINEKHFERLCRLMAGEQLLAGGGINAQTRQIEPTVLGNITPDSRIMQEEIFGPILPVLTFKQTQEVVQYVN